MQKESARHPRWTPTSTRSRGSSPAPVRANAAFPPTLLCTYAGAVAPSRVRGLKPVHVHEKFAGFRRTLTGAWIETHMGLQAQQPRSCRTLTGAWIETHYSPTMLSRVSCRTLTGAWIETFSRKAACCSAKSRTLTGAWIETHVLDLGPRPGLVAPSRVRGLKLESSSICAHVAGRTLTGAWIETAQGGRRLQTNLRRTLTGAWIETPWRSWPRRCPAVAPSRVRGLKLRTTLLHASGEWVAPSRVRGLKLDLQVHPHTAGHRRTLTGAWIETSHRSLTGFSQLSHPHGCVD